MFSIADREHIQISNQKWSGHRFFGFT